FRNRILGVAQADPKGQPASDRPARAVPPDAGGRRFFGRIRVAGELGRQSLRSRHVRGFHVPGEVLTPAEPGLFGKLPATGDFVSRGLSHAFTRAWDGWVTRHVVTRLRAGAALPDSGLRFRLVSGGRVAAGVVLASSDAAGRSYPLSLVLVAPGLPDASALDPW